MALREVVYNGVKFGISYEKIPAKIHTNEKSNTQSNTNSNTHFTTSTQDFTQESKESKNIIFLHGWGSNKELMKKAFENAFLEYNHFYIDLPGFGKSPNEVLLSTHDYAKIVSLFTHSLDIVPHIVVGHSYGGKVAVLLEEACEIILLSSAGIIVPKPLKVRTKIALAKLAKIAHIRLPFLRSKDAQNLSPIMYEIFKNIVNEDFSEIFRKCEKPTSIFWGDEDSATPLSSGRKIHSLMKNSKFCVCKGGHYFFLAQNPNAHNQAKNQARTIQTMYNMHKMMRESARVQSQNEEQMKILHIIAQGKVQGVGYRKFAKASADKIGIIGSTQNLENGEVENYALGDEERLLEFVGELWSGPARGEVENLVISEVDSTRWEQQEQKILEFLDSTKDNLAKDFTNNANSLAHSAQSQIAQSQSTQPQKELESKQAQKQAKSTLSTLQDFVILR